MTRTTNSHGTVSDEPLAGSPAEAGDLPSTTPARAVGGGTDGDAAGGGRTPPDPFDAAVLTEADLDAFGQGCHRHLARVLGAHPRRDGERATRFAVWAPNARSVSVVGDFNGWQVGADPLEPVQSSGIWSGVVVGAGHGDRYKYAVDGHGGHFAFKADPFAFHTEVPPDTASVIWDLSYRWEDDTWMAERGRHGALDAPQAIYEVHLGSWRRDPSDPGRILSCAEITPALVEHCLAGGFTHVELLPLMEHPFYGSWGYQTTGYFAPSARYGSPQDLMAMIDALHRAGIGVILDWVPSHFPTDAFALGDFDGTHLYEHADPRQGFHPDWNSYIFNYGRHEVRSFLLSSADHWVRTFHADGLRVDAVASMLYLDYSRSEGEWVPNVHGGRENLDAIALLRDLNAGLYGEHPGVQTYAEESTAWPGVSRPVDWGGLGFGYKWDMGWMHDTLQYLARDPVHRRYHHGEITFRAIYAFSENYVLPLSHDEVVYGKGSLLDKMPGDEWRKRANLRLLYGYQCATPGKKLLFMGGEFGQWREWSHDDSLDWHLLEQPGHQGIFRLVGDLNRCYRATAALHQLDCDPAGFEWVRGDDADNSTLAFLRWSADRRPALAVVNATPVVRPEVHLGVPVGGFWRELVNTDAEIYGGSGVGNLGGVHATEERWGAYDFTVSLTLPPLAVLILAPEDSAGDAGAVPPGGPAGG